MIIICTCLYVYLFSDADNVQHSGIPQLGDDEVINILAVGFILIGFQTADIPGAAQDDCEPEPISSYRHYSPGCGSIQGVNQCQQLGSEGVSDSWFTLQTDKHTHTHAHTHTPHDLYSSPGCT